MTFAKASEEKTDSERKKEKKGGHNEKSEDCLYNRACFEQRKAP